MNPPVVWWMRWVYMDNASAAMRARMRARDTENWAEALSPEDIAALKWLEDDGER